VPWSFLYHAVTTAAFAEYLANHATGAAYPAVNANDFANAQVVVPQADHLEQYQAVTGDMLELRQRIMTTNGNLRQTRDLLLPKLISGDLDLAALTAVDN
jgi:type I restriction enzyme S subunit